MISNRGGGLNQTILTTDILDIS